MAETVERFLSSTATQGRGRVAFDARSLSIHRHLDAFRAGGGGGGASPRFWRRPGPGVQHVRRATKDGRGFIDAEGGSLGPQAASDLRRAAGPTARRGACRGVVLHGTGRHTLELALVIGQPRVPVVGITDDDASRHGESLFGWSILPPGRAGRRRQRRDHLVVHFTPTASGPGARVYEDAGLRCTALPGVGSGLKLRTVCARRVPAPEAFRGPVPL